MPMTDICKAENSTGNTGTREHLYVILYTFLNSNVPDVFPMCSRCSRCSRVPGSEMTLLYVKSGNTQRLPQGVGL